MSSPNSGHHLHWPLVFTLTPSEPSFADVAPYCFDHSASIAAPPEKVFDAIVGMKGARDWVEYFVRIDWLTPDEPKDRTIFDETFYFMSLRIRNLVADRGKRWIASVDSSSLPMAEQMLEDCSFDARADGGCDFRWRVYYSPQKLIAPFRPLIAPFFDDMFKKSTANLKRFCERP